MLLPGRQTPNRRLHILHGHARALVVWVSVRARARVWRTRVSCRVPRAAVRAVQARARTGGDVPVRE